MTTIRQKDFIKVQDKIQRIQPSLVILIVANQNIVNLVETTTVSSSEQSDMQARLVHGLNRFSFPTKANQHIACEMIDEPG
jgi:glutamate racemase